MSTPNASVSAQLSRASATNFLTSLNASLSAGGDLSDLFSNLLSQTQTLMTAQPNAAQTNAGAANNTAPLPASTDNAPSSGAPSFPTSQIGDIMSQLRTFLAKARANAPQHHDAPHQASNKTQSNTQPQSSDATAQPASQQTTDANNQPSTNNTAASNTSTGTTASNNTDTTATDPNAPPNFADMLAELQAVLQMLQKQMQQTPAGTGNSAEQSTATNATDATPTGDLLAAGGALADLLALAQLMEKKLGAPSNTDPAQTPSTGANANDPTLASLDTQLRANLQTLLNALKTAANNNAATSTAAANTNTATDPATLMTASVPVASLDKAAPQTQTPADILKNTLATADDFLKQLNNFTAPAANAASAASAIAGDAITAATDKNGASFTAADDNNAGANTANQTNATQNLDQLAAAPDGKSSNYSFASQLSAARAQNGGMTGLPSAVEQVLLFLNRNAKSGSDQMTVQLHPADLGTISVKIDFNAAGTVSGTVTASNPDTLAMLQKDQRSLERALQDAGLRADPGSLQFNLGSQSQNPQGQGAQNQGAGGGNTQSNTQASGLAALEPDTQNATNESWVITPGRVNIQV